MKPLLHSTYTYLNEVITFTELKTFAIGTALIDHYVFKRKSGGSRMFTIDEFNALVREGKIKAEN